MSGPHTHARGASRARGSITAQGETLQFTVTFQANGKVSYTDGTDQGVGTYTLNGNQLTAQIFDVNAAGTISGNRITMQAVRRTDNVRGTAVLTLE